MKIKRIFIPKELKASVSDKNIIGKASNIRIVDDMVLANISFASEDKRRLVESFNVWL